DEGAVGRGHPAVPHPQRRRGVYGLEGLRGDEVPAPAELLVVREGLADELLVLAPGQGIQRLLLAVDQAQVLHRSPPRESRTVRGRRWSFGGPENRQRRGRMPDDTGGRRLRHHPRPDRNRVGEGAHVSIRRSSDRLPGEGRPVMCPACIATLALAVAGTTSTGGLGALAIRKLRARPGPKRKKSTTPT